MIIISFNWEMEDLKYLIKKDYTVMQMGGRKGIFFMKDMNFASWERRDLKNSKEK